jgi:hypothetical protein
MNNDFFFKSLGINPDRLNSNNDRRLREVRYNELMKPILGVT